MKYPAAIIYINAELSSAVKDNLKAQLFISTEMTGDEFDALVLLNPDYPSIARGQGQRVLVIRDFTPVLPNRNLIDIAIFYKNGLLYVEDKNGEHGWTISAQSVTLQHLLDHNQ